MEMKTCESMHTFYTMTKEKLTLTDGNMEYLNSTENYITSFIFFFSNKMLLLKQRNGEK